MKSANLDKGKGLQHINPSEALICIVASVPWSKPFHVGLVMLGRPPAPPIPDVGHLEQEAVAVVEPHRRSRHVLVVARPVPHAGDDHVLQGL